MNKGNDKIVRLTLTQQLVGIILLFVVAFLSFFFTYLNRNINNFVRVEMETILTDSHNSVIKSYMQSYDGKMTVSIHNTEDVSHKVWDPAGQYQTRLYRDLPAPVRNQINNIRRQMYKEHVENEEIPIETSEGNYVIKMTVAFDEDVTIVSALSQDYSYNLRNRLVNSVLNAVFLIVLLLFTLMLTWVSSIIRSLNKIQDYVNAVAKDEEATLKIYRQDEIGEVAKALVYMNEELERQEKVKAELIQNVSHDLKTPIATIKSYGESIKDGVYPYDTLEKSVDVIIEHADRLEEKVHNLLLLNRMDYLVSNNDGQMVDLKDVIEKTLVSVIPLNSTLEIIVEAETSLFVGQEESWRVACENILDNALRYAQTYIKITLTEDSLSFENDGESLTSEVKNTMFKAYEKGTDGGFGMGLSIVHRVVTAYGYSVYAENTKDGVIIRIDK